MNGTFTLKSAFSVKFPLLEPKHSLAASILTGILSVLILIWLPLQLPGVLYCGSALLLLCLFAYLLFAGEWSSAEIRYVILVFAVGTGVLVVAERNPAMMGSFSMGEGLGPFLGSVGLLCGLLYALPTMFSFPLTARLTDNIYLRSLIGGIMVTVPAILISYNSNLLNFFTWFELVPSSTGFIVWFVVSFFLHFAGHQLQVKLENPIALTLYIVWIGTQVVITILRFAS